VIASVATPPTLAPSDINAAAISRLTGEVTSLAAQLGAEHAEPISGLPLAVLEATEDQLRSLIEAGLIANLVEDVPEPPALADSVPLIHADDAAALGADGNGQTIAILDTGVERTHPFFGGRVVAEACFSSNSNADGATTVCPGGVTSSTATGSAAPCGHSSCDHGTHVAGIAAGRDATRRGVAPAANLVAIQVFSLFTDSPAPTGPKRCANAGATSPCILSYTSDQISGLQQVFNWRNTFTFAAVNMSISGGNYMTCDTDTRKPLIDQLRADGIATVIASGNGGLTAGVGAPGCITTALTVGNTTKTDAINSTSNSAAVVDMLAPGTNITSSILGGGFGIKSGTSMAAPHVAGAVAAIRSVRENLSVEQIEQALESTGVNITDARNGLSRPRIDLGAAVQPSMAGVLYLLLE
jgi:subtilisin family serine protease